MALMSSQYGRLLEPGLRAIFFETYKEKAEQYSQVFNVLTSTKAIETDYRMAGFGLWDTKESAGSTKFQETPDAISMQYVHEEFGSGFTVERKLIDDQNQVTINNMAKNLGRAARATVETKAAEVLNNSFTVNGFDGQPLFSTAHVRLDGGTMSNRLQAADGAAAADGALSDQNLKAALIQFRRQVDDRGILIQTAPDILVVPPTLEFIANTILQSNNISVAGKGSGITNDKNTLPRLRVVVLDYLTSNTAWFLLDSSVHQLNFFWRVKPEFKSDRSFETDQYKYKGYMRFSAGYSDYRGVFGSLGTGAATA